MAQSNRVLLIGGFGFIGYHLIKNLQTNGFAVTVLSRRPQEDAKKSHQATHETGSEPMEVIVQNLAETSDDALVPLLSSYDIVIFAGGADDRTVPKGDAASFFYTENVLPCVRLATASQQTAVQKIIILGSYFAYFNRKHPEWRLTEKHPYIRSRFLQETETIAAAQQNGGKTAVITLELPYIFGVAPNKVPLWKPLIQYLALSPLIFYTKGGTNMMTVEAVADAVLGAIKHGKHADCLPTGGENWTWRAMLNTMLEAMKKQKKIVLLPNFIVVPFMYLAAFYFKLTGKQSGLNPIDFIDLQTQNTWFDAAETARYLQLPAAKPLEKAIAQTVEASWQG